MKPEDYVVYEDGNFWIEQSESCPVPGYLIVHPQTSARILEDLPADALSALGPLLALASSVIQRTVGPERIYVARFGEEVEAIHFHLFPRTVEMAKLYRKQNPKASTGALNGPALFDWIRKPATLRQLKLSSPIENVLPILKTGFNRLPIE